MPTEQDIQVIVRRYIGNRIQLEDFGAEVDIFEEGLVSSLFAIELMTFLEATFGIKVGMDDLDMANFSSINGVTAFVQRKQAAGS